MRGYAPRMSSVALYVSCVAAAGIALAPALAYFGVLPPLAAFRLWLASALPGLVALALAFLAIVLRKGSTAAAVTALVLGLVPLLVAGSLVLKSRRVPLVNDVTTDLEDPPRFVQAKEIPANRGRSLEYPEKYKSRVRRGYGDLTPVVRDGTPAQLLERAVAAAKEMGWTVTAVEADRFEAVVKSTVWRFEDDVVGRVREVSPGKARLDIRSRSRVGNSDLGANAARIRALAARL